MARKKILSFAGMKRPSACTVWGCLICFFWACQSPGGGQFRYGHDTLWVDPDHPVLPPLKKNPEFRAQVKKEPVAEYQVKTDDPLNTTYFTVSLYETPRTMYYLVKVDYEGMPAEDTLKFPDLGTQPHPVLQKGQEKFACVIGFLDNDRQFRDLKLAYVIDKGKDLQLKIKTLKHYVVMDHYRLVSQ